MANEANTADQLLTIPDFGLRLGRQRKVVQNFDCSRAREMYGDHVVDFIGCELEWGNLGQIAIQCFRLAAPCVYFIGGDDGPIKIGVTNAPLERLATFQMGSPVVLRIHALEAGSYDLEKQYHRRFAEHRLHGEWFSPHPDILAEIARLTPPLKSA